MMGAYPMMARHGGKLMSELLSCVGRAQRDLQIQEKVKRKFGTSDNVDLSTKATLLVASIHTASLVLVFCSKRANEVLAKVESGSYLNELKGACFLIRQGSKAMVITES